MVKQRYLGPDVMFRQRLRQHMADLSEQRRRVSPGGSVYPLIEAAQRATDALHKELYGEFLIAPPFYHQSGPGIPGVTGEWDPEKQEG